MAFQSATPAPKAEILDMRVEVGTDLDYQGEVTATLVVRRGSDGREVKVTTRTMRKQVDLALGYALRRAMVMEPECTAEEHVHDGKDWLRTASTYFAPAG